MSSAGAAPLPPIRVTLPDGQELLGVLHERRCWPLGGWMYLVGLPMWATVSETEEVEAREYRVWLTPDHVRRPEGASYDDVPTIPLSKADQGDHSGRWGWKVQRIPSGQGGPGGVVVHVWDCQDAPAGNEEIDLFAALEVLNTAASAVACKECDAAVALGPLLDPR
ncbi:DUF6233 domain-containing protein [Streptomyces sp. NPDC057280]|uniref:DUF6233 domain-containing protein n=1 Tax=Streptomyces sp. NPDC057280 TaxID=3346081 RepID=UPI003632A174